MGRCILVWAIIVIGSEVCTLWAAKNRRYSDFPSLRRDILATMAGAERRVWLISEFISDYDISLALYVAKFRKLDVRVVLGRERLDASLSQYRYLHSHRIPIKVVSGLRSSTILICDERMFQLNSDLDFLTMRESFLLHAVVKPQIGKFARVLGVEKDMRLGQGKVYDYSRKIHKRPGYISNRLPKKTIRSLQDKLPKG